MGGGKSKAKEELVDAVKQWTELISEEPKASIYHNFLSDEECEHLINLGKPHMERSKVADTNGKGIITEFCTSSAMFLERGKDEIIQAIEKRIADVTSTPIENGEGLQILHYQVKQHFGAHYDYNNRFTSNGGPRKATFLMFLSDVEGGEIVFRLGKGISRSKKSSSELWSQGKGGLSIKPKKGNALLFWSMKPDGTRDPASFHSASAVIKGNKWSCTKWLHVSEFKGSEKHPDGVGSGWSWLGF